MLRCLFRTFSSSPLPLPPPLPLSPPLNHHTASLYRRIASLEKCECALNTMIDQLRDTKENATGYWAKKKWDTQIAQLVCSRTEVKTQLFALEDMIIYSEVLSFDDTEDSLAT